ncbi:MAG: DUF1841 family protein [Deltaproteobacteria bacterium]|nr:DUF1841 family protein [Deltaproteobacteria bacterium]
MPAQFKNVYQFKVTLKDIRPPIWRRIQVPENYSFWELHVAILDAMGWLGYHLHAFEIFNPKRGIKEEIGIPDEEWGLADVEMHAGWEKRISGYFTLENNKALYTYDFGDDWRHAVVLEKILPKVKDATYPLCIKGKRACPPEDCGGPWGYQDLLEILSNPDDERYDEMMEWLDGGFDPEHFVIDEIQFEDPDARLKYILEDDDDVDDIDLPSDEEDIFSSLRVMQREEMHALWEKAKNLELDGLDPEEKQIAKIMLDHQDEFFNDFEFSDVTADREYDPETESNPFLHIYIHCVIETQLEIKDPIEALQFYNAMRQKKYPHHDTLHLLGAILAPLMFSTLQTKTPFQIDNYKKLLTKYKKRRPDKIFDLLETEPLLSITE